MPFRVFRFRRFSSQLLLLLAGLIALVQVAVYLLISRANERNAVEHIDQSLQTGVRIFQQNLAERIDYLAGSAKVMSSDYPIRQLMMQEPLDRKTLRSALVTYSERVKAPVITLLSLEGEVVALTDDELGSENTGPFRELVRLATKDDLEQISGYSYLAGRLHVLVVVPLYAPYPNVAAWFGVAYPIDTKFAQAIKSTTRLDVTFTSDDPEVQPPRVLSTTLDGPMAQAVARHVPAPKNGPLQSETVTLNGEDYVTLFQRLDLLGEAPVRIALQRSLLAELAPARELENIVLLISLAALATATLAALWIAHGISQPLQQLAAHTESVATGDYTRRIDLPREDELGQLATAFNHMTAGLAERDRVRDLLGKVVSPEIAAQLLQSDLKLGGEEREVTILFCDLRNFTGMSEQMNPTDVLALLNRYLDRMSTIIERHGGVIDKYIGDAIMALFGAPVTDAGAAGKAIAAAREMAQALEVLNRELVAEGQPALAFGIGINTARVVAGNMGSKTRLNYTVIGDGVNLASRLESLTKEPGYDTPIIISEATLHALPVPPSARALGEVKVKGKADAVKIFALTAKGQSHPPYAV
ncbi:MAG: adenylate/guanylate cyclase domain-containing protein [bacterium]|nr:adenylate/guanylate cyclase domain-containing protein [bacterium]MDI1334782.1 adenylate/guanylate cyclase domain-containing protein [Lacunisphaera sp.]